MSDTKLAIFYTNGETETAVIVEPMTEADREEHGIKDARVTHLMQIADQGMLCAVELNHGEDFPQFVIEVIKMAVAAVHSVYGVDAVKH